MQRKIKDLIYRQLNQLTGPRLGKTLVSKDGLDMGKIVNDREVDYQTSHLITIEYGDHERISIPKTIL